MLEAYTRFFTRLFAGMTLLAALPASAQTDPWFKVELIVFSQSSGPSAERMEPMPKLSYPEKAQFLVEADYLASTRNQYRTNTTIDSYGRQVLVTSGAAPAPNQATSPTGVPAAATSVPSGQPLSPAFLTLAPAQFSLGTQAATLARSGRYQVLFHKAWLQPVGSEERALPIVLDRSGDTGRWTELQGSIKVYLSRYLFLETNLWQNTSGAYLNNNWNMPAPPLGPPSILGLPVVEPAANTVAQVAATSPPAGAGGNQATAPVYPFRHAVLLQQKRRMRSGETHYIDHPMLGVIARITPLTPEEQARLNPAAAQPLAPATSAPLQQGAQ